MFEITKSPSVSRVVILVEIGNPELLEKELIMLIRFRSSSISLDRLRIIVHRPVSVNKCWVCNGKDVRVKTNPTVAKTC